MADDEVTPLSTPTTNYGWAKPAVGGDVDAWGGMLNTDLDQIDSTVKSVSTVANAAVPLAGGTMTGPLTMTPNSGLNGAAGTARSLTSKTSGSPRWELDLGNTTAESGGNVGSDFTLTRYSDAGVFIDSPLSVARSSGVSTFSQNVLVGTGYAGDAYLNLNAKQGTNYGGIIAYAGWSLRWIVTLAGTPGETGSGNTGSDFAIQNFTDAGAQIGTPLSIKRSSGVTTIANLSAPQAIGDNRIINGDMRIDQRNNGASGTAVGYTVDRWQYSSNQAAKGAWQRTVAGPPLVALGFGYSLVFTSSSAYTIVSGDYFRFMQIIEADMVSDFAFGTANAQPVTLSFWATSSLTGTFGGSVTNVAGNRSCPFSYSIPSAGVWTKVSITIPGDTAGTWVMSGNAGSVVVNFSLGAGATFSGAAGAWAGTSLVSATGSVSVVGTNGATFQLDGVKLEIGSVATPFNRQSLAKSLADCQRYYFSGPSLWHAMYAAAGQNFGHSLIWPVTMRVIPTVAFVGPIYTNASGGATTNLTTAGAAVYAMATALGQAFFQTTGLTATAEL